MPNVGTNDETAIVTVAGDGYHANDSGFSAVTTTPVLSPLPQFEDAEGAFNVFAYLKSVAGSNAWTVLSFISTTGAINYFIKTLASHIFIFDYYKKSFILNTGVDL